MTTPRTFRRSFWQPPRAHGEATDGRRVSFLELFYDLVYVVVIAEAAHHLSAHVTWRGVAEFTVVFAMVWLAWVNGTIYYDLHGREDGRTRTFVFIQMALLALLAVFTGDAPGADGTGFALVYATYLGIFTWLWYTVRRQDDERFQDMTMRYVVGMGGSAVLLAATSLLDDDTRLIVWALYAIAWIVGQIAMDNTRGGFAAVDVHVTDSMIERFGLFTIIVLGEVVVGVVTGIADAERTGIVIVTGMIGLMIGFAYWWTYFDFVGGREVRRGEGLNSRWMMGHLPTAIAIAASGAAMVSLVEHAGDGRTPAATAWLLTGSVALGLLALVVIIPTLIDAGRLPTVYGPMKTSLGFAAVVSLAVGMLRPPPWLLALLLVIVLGYVWAYSIAVWVKRTDPDEHVPSLG